MRIQIDSPTQARQGFSRVDLIAASLMIAVLSCIVVPTAAKSRSVDLSATCRWNLAQLTRAWTMYTDDNRAVMPSVFHGTEAMNPIPNDPRAPWAAGWLDWGISSHNTNSAYLIDPKYSSLARYLSGNGLVHKCPADRFLSGGQLARGWSQRVRSVSANVVVGSGNAESGPFNMALSHLKKMSDFRFPSPSNVMLYLDEHADSINDPGFWPPSQNQFIDLPGNYHDGAAGIAFADGRAETHRWANPTLRSLKVSTANLGTPTGDVKADADWLLYHSPRIRDLP